MIHEFACSFFPSCGSEAAYSMMHGDRAGRAEEQRSFPERTRGPASPSPKGSLANDQFRKLVSTTEPREEPPEIPNKSRVGL